MFSHALLLGLTATSTDPFSSWPYLPTLERVALALALGLFIGLERQRRGKEAGVRTFAFAALLGCLGGLEGPSYGLLALGLIGILVVFLNANDLVNHVEPELTTSAALLVVGFVGIMCGQGHTFTPVVVGIAVASLLAWKERLVAFSVGLTEAELRSAILLAVLAFVIYPILPAGTVGPRDLIDPRSAWITVVLIATIGFANYVLLKLFGARGVELAGFFGGLVNSTVTVTELANRVNETNGAVSDEAYRGVMLSIVAMLLRNAALLWLLAGAATPAVAIPLALMVVVSLVLALGQIRGRPLASAPPLALESPFSITSVLRFGLIFLALQVAGGIASQSLGSSGLYAVSAVGGVVSSASAVASAGVLASHGAVSLDAAGAAAIIASLGSVLVNVPLVARIGLNRRLTSRVAWSAVLVVGTGLASAVLETAFFASALASWRL